MIEYDPQPPFDSGHMSKASASTKAGAIALLGRDIKPEQLTSGVLLGWHRAIRTARGRSGA